MMDLLHFGYWLAIALLAGLVMSLLFSLRKIRCELHMVSRSIWVCLVFILALAGVIRFGYLPYQHNVFYDEFSHLDIAARAYTEHRFAVCSNTHVEPEMNSCRYPKWGPGFGVLNALWYQVTDEGRKQSFFFNRAIGTMSVAAAFCFGFFVLGSAGAGLWMALLLAVYPLHLKFSGGTSLEPLSVFFLLLSSAITAVFARSPKSIPLFSAAVFSLAYCSLVRIENLLVTGPLLVFATLQLFRSGINKRARFAGAIVAVILAGILIAHGFHTLHLEKQFHASGNAIALINNITFWLTSSWHPLLFTLAALPGIWLFWKKSPRTLIAFFLFFAAYWILYSAIHRVDFGHLDFCRFALQPAIFFLAMTALTFDHLARAEWRRIVLLVGLILVAVFYDFKSVTASLRPAFSQEIAFLEQTVKKIPQNAIILSDIPVVHKVVQERVAIRREVLQSEDEITRLVKTGRPVYLYCGIVCNLRKKNDGNEMLIPRGWIQESLAQAEGGSVQLHMGNLDKVDFEFIRLRPW